MARPDGAGDRRLVAYCVPSAGTGHAEIGAAELRAHLCGAAAGLHGPCRLRGPAGAAAHQRTARWTARACPLPEEVTAAEAPGAGPATPLEEVVAGIWCEVLGLPRVSRTDDFFELGGHSLLATQVASRLRAATGAELPIALMFQATTVAALAAALGAALADGASAAAAPPIRRVARGGDLPLSFAQERLWFLDRLAPGNAAYNIPLALAARGRLSLAALWRGRSAPWYAATRCCAPLTRCAAAGRSRRSRRPPDGACRWSTSRHCPEGSARVRPAVSSETRSPAPSTSRAARCCATSPLRLEPAEHALLLVVHHVAADGWSMGVMLEEIAALYPLALGASSLDRSPTSAVPSAPSGPRGVPQPPELPVQYADFAAWQREWLTGEVLDRQLAYWRERLAGLPVLDLPTDRPRPPLQSFRGATADSPAPAGDRRGARGAGAGERGHALHGPARRGPAPARPLRGAGGRRGRLADRRPHPGGDRGADRLLRQHPGAARRPRGRPAVRRAGGARPREAALAPTRTRTCPSSAWSRSCAPSGGRRTTRCSRSCSSCRTPAARAIELPGLGFAAVDFELPATRFDLEVSFSEEPAGRGGLAAQLTYSTDLFDAATVLRLAGHLDVLLAAVLADPSRPLSRAAAALRARAAPVDRRVERHRGRAPAPRRPRALLEQARRRPDAVAVSFEEGD